MGIPPGVPVTAVKVHRAPRIVARIIQLHNGQNTLGGTPGRTGGVAPGSRTALIRKALFI